MPESIGDPKLIGEVKFAVTMLLELSQQESNTEARNTQECRNIKEGDEAAR